MIFKNNFIINPDKYLLPDIKISPFSTPYIFKNIDNARKVESQSDYFTRYIEYNHIYTINARSAIEIALKNLALQKEDEISILTTSDNFYISGCVTHEIENFCRWSREITERTKVIFVNHEFGFPYENLSQLKQYNLPIIEDCAHSFFSQNKEGSVGKIGDYIVFSLPKIFPIQIGGVLLSKKTIPINNKNAITPDLLNYIEQNFAYYINDMQNITDMRRSNFQYLEDKFSHYGFMTRFKLENYHVPGVFMFLLPGEIDAQHIKTIYWKNGIENSVFYKENCVFIPVHQNLGKRALDFFVEILLENINILGKR